MKKNLPLAALMIIAVILIGGYFGFLSSEEKAPPSVRDLKVPSAQESPGPTAAPPSVSSLSKPAGQNLAPEAPEVSPANPGAGEKFVSGQVKAVDLNNRILTIDQEMDDNSVQINPNIPVPKDAVLRNKAETITLSKINPGDSVGVIILANGQARAVLVNF